MSSDTSGRESAARAEDNSVKAGTSRCRRPGFCVASKQRSEMMGALKADEAAQLIVDTEQRVARVIVTVDAVDVAVVEPLEKLLQDAARADVRRLEIDLSGVSFADSNVVRLAMQVREWVAPRGAHVAIKAPPAVRRVFDLTRTSDLFEIIEPA